MRAAVYEKFGPPEVLQIRAVRRPTPREYEVLVRISATTVVVEDPGWCKTQGSTGF
jgi:NADPH:quinone reductase-like Zn-dependent oxidoreductase